MIVVDSGVWIDYFKGTEAPHTEKLDSLLSIEQIGVGDLVLAEVLQGYSQKKEFDAALKVLSVFEPVVIGGRTLAIAASRNYVTLRSLGFTIRKTVDTLIVPLADRRLVAARTTAASCPTRRRRADDRRACRSSARRPRSACRSDSATGAFLFATRTP